MHWNRIRIPWNVPLMERKDLNYSLFFKRSEYKWESHGIRLLRRRGLEKFVLDDWICVTVSRVSTGSLLQIFSNPLQSFAFCSRVQSRSALLSEWVTAGGHEQSGRTTNPRSRSGTKTLVALCQIRILPSGNSSPSRHLQGVISIWSFGRGGPNHWKCSL